MDVKNVYPNIKRIAKEKKMEVREVERAAGVSPGYFSRMKDKSVSITALIKAKDYLGVTLEDLLNEPDRIGAAAPDMKLHETCSQIQERMIQLLDPANADPEKSPKENIFNNWVELYRWIGGLSKMEKTTETSKEES